LNIHCISGGIEDDTLIELTDFLSDAGGKDVTILVSSYGGLADVGIGAFDLLRLYPGKVITVGLGHVASSGVLVYLGGSERLTTKRTTFLVHSPTVKETEINFNSIKDTNKTYKEFTERLVEALLDSTKLTKKEIEKLFKTEKELNCAEVVKYGISHKVVEKLPKYIFK
jgi:ATP-dependent Clp protease, protease subunit